MFCVRSEPGPEIGRYESLDQAREALQARLARQRDAGHAIRFNDRLQFEVRAVEGDAQVRRLLWIEDETGQPVASRDSAEAG
jgi:hypothetical protein